LPIRVIGCRWLLSPRGRPSPSLLERTLSEQAGGPNVVYKSIAVFPSTSTSSATTSSYSARDPRPCLGLHPRTPPLVTLVAISAPLFSAGFLCFGLEISTPIRLFNRGSYLFSSFGNLILAQADASFQLVSVLPIYPLLGNCM
jgi:hypothetical protein